MDDKDFNRIRTIVREEVGTTVKQEISESEARLRTMVKEEITASEGRIGQFLEERVIPLIEQKADKTDIDRLEGKLDNNIARTMEQGHRLDTLESLPMIAHELKVKKHK